MATYTIREVAQRFHVQTSTLRYYEDQGLLCDVERDDAGRRVYTDSHIGRLEAIACFKHAGMSIDELKRFFAYEKDERAHIADMLELLESRHQAILKQRAALEAEIRQHGDALLQYRLRGTKRGEMSSIGAHKNLVAKASEAMPAVTG